MDIEAIEIKDKAEKKVIDDIKQYGWSIMHVFDDKNELPNFSYSVGIFHTFKQPEIIVYGMPNDSAQILINNVGSSLKDTDIVEGKEYRGFINDQVPCVFRKVSQDHYKEHFGFNTWLYKNNDFPVMQLIWPDKGLKFPWDKGFDETKRQQQPLLFS